MTLFLRIVEVLLQILVDLLFFAIKAAVCLGVTFAGVVLFMYGLISIDVCFSIGEVGRVWLYIMLALIGGLISVAGLYIFDIMVNDCMWEAGLNE